MLQIFTHSYEKGETLRKPPMNMWKSCYGGQNSEMGSLWLRFGPHLSQTVHTQAQHVPHVSITIRIKLNCWGQAVPHCVKVTTVTGFITHTTNIRAGIVNWHFFFFLSFFFLMFVKFCIGETGHIEGMLVWKLVLVKANAVKMSPTPICLLLLCYFCVLYTRVFKAGFQCRSDKVPHRALTKRRRIYSDNNSNHKWHNGIIHDSLEHAFPFSF